MGEPVGMDAEGSLRRLRGILKRRGLNIEPGSIDDAASPDEPGHPEFHRRQRVNSALVKLNAIAPPRYATSRADHAGVVAWADQVVADPAKAPSLLLWGGTGSGKTHQAYGAFRRIAESGPERFGFWAIPMADLYAALRPGAGDDLSRERTMRRAMTVPLLLLDDIGSARESAWTEEITYRVINHRYNHQLPTVLTTNVRPADLPSVFGDRTASRLIGMTTAESRIHIDCPDRRMSLRSTG